MTIRHPFRGLIGGLIFGLGLVMMLIFLSIAVLGNWTFIGFMVGFGLIGLLIALLWPPRREPPPQA